MGAIGIEAGGKHTGKLTFEAGASAFISEGAILDFGISQTAPGEDALVNDLSFVLDQPVTYTRSRSTARALRKAAHTSWLGTPRPSATGPSQW